MKKLIAMVIIFCMHSGVVYASTQDILDIYQATGAEEFLVAENEIFGNFNGEAIMQNLVAGNGVGTENILEIVMNFFFKTLKGNFALCAGLICLNYLMGLFQNLTDQLGGKTVSVCGHTVFYCVYAGMLATVFSGLAEGTIETTENLSLMVKSLIPILLSLLTTAGAPISGGLLSCVLIGAANLVLLLIEGIVVPFIYCSFAVSIASNMSDKVKLSGAVPFMHKIIKWILVFVMAAFSGLYSVYGLSGSALDRTTGKLARFAIGSGIPLVGGIAADSLESVLTTFGACRNLIGVTAIVLIAAILIVPVIEAAATMWLFKLCGVIIEPFSDSRAVKLINDASECIQMLFAVLVSVGLIFVGGIGVILITGSFVM